MAQLLLLALLLPLAGAALTPNDQRRARCVALLTTIAVLLAAVVLVVGFTANPVASAGAVPNIFAETDLHRAAWAGTALDVHFHVALDGLTLWLFTLTALLSVVAVLVGWNAVQDRAAAYYRLLLVLETAMLGAFAARDIILFYVFFEFTLLPLFFLIGLWGGQERKRAAVTFFLFTLAGSLLTFLGFLGIVAWHYYNPISNPANISPDVATAAGTTIRTVTFSIDALAESLRQRPMPIGLQLGVFAALFAGFAVKTPLFPLHTWLPLAHVEAPTAGSVLLAGVLLKIGTYGFLRFCLPMTPDAVAVLMPTLLWIALAGVLYGALVALAQSDIKRLIAYSSVSHLGFCMLGIFACTPAAVRGGALLMISHGLATGGLFAVVGMLYERFHTRRLADFGGLAATMPRLTFFAFIFALSSIGLPGLAGFAGEFPLLAGVFQRGWATNVVHADQFRTIAVLSLGGVILGAWYMLAMCRQVFFGKPVVSGQPVVSDGTGKAVRSLATSHQPLATNANPSHDLSLREICCLAPLAVLILWIGLQPSYIVDRMGPTLDRLSRPTQDAVQEQDNKLNAFQQEIAKPQAAFQIPKSPNP
jgi:NADH-quinone oxidoreductase subunit M